MDYITPNIAIGHSEDAKNLDKEFDACLNVAFDLDIPVSTNWEYNKVGLIDGPGNTPDVLIAAVYMLQQLLCRHNKVLVHCHSGRSRSSTVIALYLTFAKGMNFDDAVKLITQKHPITNIHPKLRELAKEVLQKKL
jgi:predicted protein tyrosine phosphatase